LVSTTTLWVRVSLLKHLQEVKFILGKPNLEPVGTLKFHSSISRKVVGLPFKISSHDGVESFDVFHSPS